MAYIFTSKSDFAAFSATVLKSNPSWRLWESDTKVKRVYIKSSGEGRIGKTEHCYTPQTRRLWSR